MLAGRAGCPYSIPVSPTLPLFADATPPPPAGPAGHVRARGRLGVASRGRPTPPPGAGSSASSAFSPAPSPVGAHAATPDRQVADPGPRLAPPQPLHPAVWRAHQLAQGVTVGQPSGFAALDAELPGGGWPKRALTEVLLPHPGLGELRLLAPALVALQRQGRCVMWVDPPARLCPWAWQALGGALDTLVLVQRRDRDRDRARALLAAPDMLWSLEQALASGHLGAVVGWLPARLPPDALRRLQLAAQAHDGPAFLLRDAAVARHPSPAPLRLVLGPDGPDALRVQILKRRGPPTERPLRLSLAPTLSAPERARARRTLVPSAAASMAPVTERPMRALAPAAPVDGVGSIAETLGPGLTRLPP